MSLSVKQAEQFFRLRRDWLGDEESPVEPCHSQSRANVCSICPKNVRKPLQEIFSAPFASEVRKQIEYKNHLKLSVLGEDSLHICDACQCVLRLKVHVPIKFIAQNTTREILEDMPDFCWVKHEIKTL